MSNRSQKRGKRADAEQRWPRLFQMLACHFNQDFALMYGSLENAFSEAISEGSLEHRRALLKEWRDWNGTEGTADDIRPALNDGLAVDLWFKNPIDARNFMNSIYDALLAGIKAETQPRL